MFMHIYVVILMQIPGLSDDPTQEPFQDISVGGTSIPGSNPSYLALWAVTFQGKVCLVFALTVFFIYFLSKT